MNNQTIVCCVVALLLGMLLANMLKNVCGCKVVEGQCSGVWGNRDPNLLSQDCLQCLGAKGHVTTWEGYWSDCGGDSDFTYDLPNIDDFRAAVSTVQTGGFPQVPVQVSEQVV